MSKYRFKTEEEFKRDGLWNKNRPFKWVSVMNKYLGQNIPDKYNQACDKQEKFRYDQWHIEPHDYVLKEIQSEYTVGKWYSCKNWNSPVDFIKLECVYDGQAYFTECLNAGNYQKEGQNWWSIVGNGLFEADMSIVSPLLPDGHADKINAEEFVLPEKWCIKVTEENIDTLGKWRSAGPLPNRSYAEESWYLHTPKKRAKGYNEPTKDPDYTEITFEQFKQHVLKESPVVESPKEIDMKDIQEEAKKRFPIGCKFIPVGDTQTYTLIEDDCTYEIRGEYIWAHDGHGHLYGDGKWATLVSLPETKKEMFYEGDYIVTLINDANCGKVNYCSKQSKDSDYLQPVIDTKGYPNNGNSKFLSTDTSNTKWRYATPEEAAEYERIGKPYDVTTLQTIPEYIECTSSKDSEPYFIKGNVYKVVKASPISSAELKCNILKDYEEHNILYTRLVDTDGTKLFKPSTKEAYEAQNASVKTEYIPQVGDYVVMERAGGWGYHPENNGCIAIVEKVSTRNVGYSSSSVTVSSIGGQVINAKRLGDVTFTNVPIVSHEKQLVFRKALPHEIPNGLPKKTVVTEWLPDPIVEQRISTPSIKKETFIDNVQSVDVILRTKRKSIKF